MTQSFLFLKHRMAANRVGGRHSLQPTRITRRVREGTAVQQPAQPDDYSFLKEWVDALDDFVGKLFVELDSLQDAIEVRGGNEIILKTGDASITLKKDGTIHIKGKDITIDGSGKVTVKASGDVVMKGNKILQN